MISTGFGMLVFLTNLSLMELGTSALSCPPSVRVRATAKLSAAFFHYESSITIGGSGTKAQ